MIKKYAIGLDIGGSKIRGILWDGKKVLRSIEKPTPKNLKLFKKIISDIIAALSKNKSIYKIGIGSAGVIYNTTIKYSPNIRYIKNLNLKILLPKTKIKLDNDAQAFLKAESTTLLKKNKLVGVTLGTGIGRAVFKNDKILKLKKLEYPENWEKEYQATRDSKNNDLLAEILVKHLKKIIQKYKPDALVLGGGVATRKGLILKLKHAFKKRNISTPILRSKLGKNATAIGAVLLGQ